MKWLLVSGAAVLLLITGGCGSQWQRQVMVYKTVDGVDLQVEVHDDPNRDVQATLLWLHGGALMHGDRSSVPEDEIGWWVGRGYRVAVMDYRLAPETELPGILEDLRDAWTWLHERGPSLGVDPARLVLVGQSAGGFLALSGGQRLRPAPAAVVTLYGFGRASGDWLSRKAPDCADAPGTGAVRSGLGAPGVGARTRRSALSVDSRQRGQWTADILGDTCPDLEDACVRSFNPLDHVTPDFPPTMLIHGEQDQDVPVDESRRMADALKGQGVEHEFLTLARRAHGFDTHGVDDPVVQHALSRAERFVALVLRGRGR